MRPRLLSFLACPEDGGGLRLISSPEDISLRGPVPCAQECAISSGVTGQDNCGICLGVEVDSGTLVCERCGAEYSVSDGIPSLLPMALLAPQSSSSRDKRSEMRSRDAQARGYDRLRMLKLLTRLEKPLVMRIVGHGGTLVELGCGTGRFTAELGRRYSEVVAIDFSRASLQICAGKVGLNVHLVHGDITKLPLGDGFFDTAVSCQVLEHLPGEHEKRQALAEASRVLRQGGKFAVSAYNYTFAHALFAKKEGYHPGKIYYLRMTAEEFRDILSDRFTVEMHRRNVGAYVQVALCRKST